MDLEADLGVDSIKRVQVLGALRERFPQAPTVGPEQLAELRTLDQITEFVTAASPPAGPRAGGLSDGGQAVDTTGALAGGVDPKAVEPDPAPRRVVRLVTLPALDQLDRPFAESPVAVLAHWADPVAALLLAALRARGWTVRELDLDTVGRPSAVGGPQAARGDVPDGREEAVDGALTVAFDSPVDLCLTLLTPGAGWEPTVARLAESIQIARRAHGPLTTAAAGGTRAAFVTLTRLDGGLGHHGTAGPVASLLGGVGGLVKTLDAEAPAVFCRALDASPDLPIDTLADLLDAELHDAARDTPEVGLALATGPGPRGAVIRTTVVPGLYGPRAGVRPEPSGGGGGLTVGADDVLVVSGGARGVTALCVRALAEQAPARFVLLGRSPLADEPDWAAAVPGADLKAAVIARLRAEGTRPTPREVERIYQGLLAAREIRATLAAVAASGARAEYVPVDVTDADSVRTALDGVRGQVTGIVHGAGVLADARLVDKTPADVARVFAPKLAGLRALLDGLDGAPLRHLVLFTSVAGLFGNPGQADYAAANEALCRVAAAHRHAHPDHHVVAIDWGAWDGGMVTPGLRDLFAARGVRLLAPDAGAAAFVATFRADRPAADHAGTDSAGADSAGADSAGADSAGADRGERVGIGPGETVSLLVGPDRALADTAAVPSDGESAGGIAGGGVLRARRTLAGIETHPVIAAHQVGAHRVLPATFGLGWMINVAERAIPGRRVVEARGFIVHKGIVFDGSAPDAAQVILEAAGTDGDGRLVLRAAVRSDGTGRLPVPHYAATLLLAGPTISTGAETLAGPGTGWPGYPLGAGPLDGLDIYLEGTQFHGPRLQGMRRVLARGADRLVLECQLADDPDLHAGYGGALHSPVLADVLLQGPPVLGRALLGQACLPLGIGRAEYLRPLPDSGPFVLVLDQARVDDGGGTATVTATAHAPDGTVLARFSEVTVAATPGMAAKFAEAVGGWNKNPTEHETTTETEGDRR
ncbi:SDR family NAD(P)-dependent oxidoreductase [Frankia sp. AiPa1]|nr:SDR family NAD(P)-dependent oxidoreductase [Frankia sp. AiPa1]